ncbi:MAG: hypothetical protein WCF17_08535 [Terracidiphilus sp.]
MRNISRILAVAIGVAVFASTTGFCAANNSNASTVTLTATLPESLTIAATPSAVTFNLVAGSSTNSGSAPVAITTSWVLNGSRSTVTLTGWFSSAAQALAGTGSTPAYIPTSEILGQVTTGAPTSYTAFTQAVTGGALGVSGASLVLFQATVDGTHRNITRTDNLNLEINLASQTQLPADVYTGTLNIQAQAL